MPTNKAIRLNRTYVEDGGLPARRNSAFQVIRHQLEMSEDISMPHRKEMLSIALWKWTEAAGVAPHAKYHLRLRSVGALDLDAPASVNHEHVWPRKWLIERLLANPTWTDGELRSFLEDHAVACTVTEAEHARLGAVPGLGWARYAAAGVEVWDMLEDQSFALPKPAPGENKSVVPAEDLPEDAADETTGPASAITPDDAIEQMAGEPAGVLRALLRRLGGDDVVVAVGRRRGAEEAIGGYLRIHDNTLGEPSSAVAYVHWNGKASFRLLESDLPSYLAGTPDVRMTNHGAFGVESRLTDDDSVDVAEALLELALEKTRAW